MKRETSLQDYAFLEIRKRIQNGTYPPGSKLSTQEISDSLGISRTPVVAAINRLVAQGVAEAIPNRGVTVAKITPRRILETVDIRMMIERFCVRPAIKNVDYAPEIIAEMQELVDALQDIEDFNAAYELESRFHTLYVKLAHRQHFLPVDFFHHQCGFPAGFPEGEPEDPGPAAGEGCGGPGGIHSAAYPGGVRHH